MSEQAPQRRVFRGFYERLRVLRGRFGLVALLGVLAFLLALAWFFSDSDRDPTGPSPAPQMRPPLDEGVPDYGEDPH